MVGTKVKLVTNKKVIKYPRDKGSVRATLKRAMDKAQKHGALDVIVISRDKGGCDISCSNMSLYMAFGLLKRGELLLTPSED